MYTYCDRISYSEVGADQKLDFFSLINYFQDCGCFHSDDLGCGLEYLAPQNLGWFVVNYEIHINKMPVYGQKVKIGTHPYGFRGLMGNRIYVISSMEEEVLVYADSTWVLMNLEKNRPARIPTEVLEGYSTSTLDMEFQFEGCKLFPIEEAKQVGKFMVSETYIDTNDHMNNSYYIDVTRRFIPDMEVHSIKINYKKPAQFKDELDVLLAPKDNGYQVLLTKEQEIYTIVEYN